MPRTICFYTTIDDTQTALYAGPGPLFAWKAFLSCCNKLITAITVVAEELSVMLQINVANNYILAYCNQLNI